ncbi:MAG: hypothetical protein K5637_08125 [Lachnospiraceae bacterium]|nr:hypothetical protein [Lachnospiraceae bacterium]
MKKGYKVLTVMAIGCLMCAFPACKSKTGDKETSSQGNIEVVEETGSESGDSEGSNNSGSVTDNVDTSLLEGEEEYPEDVFGTFDSNGNEEVEVMIPSDTVEQMDVQESGEIEMNEGQGGSF